MEPQYRLEPCISPEDIEKQVARLADAVNRDYEGKDLLVIGILKGACIFTADLVRRLTVPLTMEFVRLSSYGHGSESCGKVCMTEGSDLPVKGRNVLIVEDIVDTGLTLSWFLDYLKNAGAASVKICAFIDKQERRRVEVPVDYIGLRLESGFLVGYGLDYAEKHRNLPGIHTVRFLE